MSRGRLQYSLIASWFVALLFMAGPRMVVGSTAEATPEVSRLLLACIPPAVLLLVCRGAPDADAARGLYETGHASEQPIPATARGPGAVRSITGANGDARDPWSRGLTYVTDAGLMLLIVFMVPVVMIAIGAPIALLVRLGLLLTGQ